MALNVIKLLENGYDNVVSGTSSILNNLSTTQVAVGTATAGVIAGGAVVGAIASRKKSKRKSKRKAKCKKKAGKRRKLKFGSKAYRKRYLGKKRKKRHTKVTKRTSHKRIRMTKKGQPYVILANGRARFIKKSSARKSRKLKGGRY